MAAPTPHDASAEVGDARSSAVKSAARTLQLLEALAERGGVPARLAELADELGAPRSSVHALLRTLAASGWVRTDPTGTLYAIGLRSLLVGTSILDSDPYLRAARPVLAALRDRLGETVHLARLDGDRVVYLTTQESGREPRRIARVGRWLPAHSTSLGKALLAERGDLPTGPLAALTPRTLTTPEALAADLVRTRERGYAVDDEENTPGLRCIGVALRYAHPVLDAISCSVPVDRMTPERETEVASALLAARTQIEDTAPVQGVF
ncbi:IclR family transcriptional regulator [Cellulomonas triticagri]|uniref:IclR family transcriptional regulator n=1 Tax=Cellulomonas triticagri TaxID=2483352 RepID=UPI0018F369C7|nr:IclR family transcriptional regulator [Cellulomonas triticagri]